MPVLQVFFGGRDDPALRVEFFELSQLVSDGLTVVVRLIAVNQADERVLYRVTAQFVQPPVKPFGTFAELPRLSEMLGKHAVIRQALGIDVGIQPSSQ